MSVVRSTISIPIRKTKTSVSYGRVAGALSGFAERCFAPVDVASIVCFRILFGLIMFWEVYRYFDRGWIPRYWINPPYNFPYVGFEWVTPWPGAGMYIHFYALGFLAICITLGWWYRISAVLFFFAFTYISLLEKANYLNHFYLISLLSFLMIFIPAHRAMSIDALNARSRPAPFAPAWALWILRLQMSVVYIYGGIAKLNGDWLRGEPMRSWLANRTDFPGIGRWFTDEWMVGIFVYGGIAFDLFIVPLLLWRRTRWLALGAAFVFHLTNYQLFSIGVFPFLSLATTVLFFPPDFPRRVVRWFQLRVGVGVTAGKSLSSPPSPARTPFGWSHRLILAAVGVYVAIQLLAPLRHHIYPGNVAWTEEGHPYSWRMKLRSKSGDIWFFATDPVRDVTFEVDPYQYLTPRQVGTMAPQPDMIVQFSHYLADQLRADGHGEVEIRAVTMASLNGREQQPLIDPTVNLAAEELTFAPATYILPLTTPLYAESDDDDTTLDATPEGDEFSAE